MSNGYSKNTDEKFSDSLVLVYGFKCPLLCDFCCHPLEEFGTAKMNPDEVIQWISSAISIPSIKLVVFTGGEPFVYYNEIISIMRATAETGLKFRIVTSAYWAFSLEKAKSKLARLKEVGLTELSISTDPSHQVFVPSSYVENAAKAALELGLATELAGVFWDPDIQVQDVVHVPEGVNVTRHFAIPIGRGRKKQVKPQDYRLGSERFGPCGHPKTHSITVYPDGEVYPCCSGGFNIQAKLSMGNIKKEPLHRIVERIYTNRYVRLVTEEGFNQLYDLCRFKFPELAKQLPDTSEYVSPCQLCARIHSDSNLMKTLEPVLDYADQVTKAVRKIAIRK